jgi:hypothetical protein
MTSLVSSLFDATPRPGLQHIPNTKPLTVEAALLPPLIYYLALLFLPPPPPQSIDTLAIKLLRNVLASIAGILFFRLPLAYHVPQSIGLNYQLALVGLYGGCRVLDAFFISPYGFGHIPRRVRYKHISRVQTPRPVSREGRENSTPVEQSTSVVVAPWPTRTLCSKRSFLASRK